MTREAHGAAGFETERKYSDTFAKRVALLAALQSTAAEAEQLHGWISQVCSWPEILTSSLRSLIARLFTMNPLEMQHFRHLSHKHRKVI